MLLPQPRPLVAQVVDHPVVDGISSSISGWPTSRNLDVNSSSRIRRSPSAAKPELTVELARDMTPTANEMPKTTSTPNSHNGWRGRGRRRVPAKISMEDDEVGDGAAAQPHTVIPYFTKRR